MLFKPNADLWIPGSLLRSRGSIFQILALLNLKKPCYLVVLAIGRWSKSLWHVLYEWKSCKSYACMLLFFDEFSMLLERLVSSLGNLLFKNGDFNFHVNDPYDSTTSQFLDLLNSFYLDIFNLCTPTHKNNNVIITRSGETSVSNLSVHNPVISDHFAVHCSLAIKKPPNAKLTVMTRKLPVCNIDSDSLLIDIHSSSL